MFFSLVVSSSLCGEKDRQVTIVSSQLVVPEDDGQDTRFPFKWSSPLVHGLVYRFTFRCLPSVPIDDEELRMTGPSLDIGPY